MEFDILNDILTSTVAKLFPDSHRSLNYFRCEEEYVKAEIPKSSNRDRENFISSFNLKEISVNNNSNSKKRSDIDSKEDWVKGGDKRRLEEAFKRLGVDEQRCKNKNLTNFGMDFLLSEKNKVKSELKKFDNDFFEIFQRYPGRSEKEVMRMIYMYYKNLKQAITYKQSNNDKNIEKNKPESSLETHSRQISALSSTQNSHNNTHTEAKKTGVLQNNYTYSQKNKTNPNELNGYNQNKSNPNNTDDFSSLLDLKKPDMKKKNISLNSHSQHNLMDLEKEYESLKKEQVLLKQKLHNYQKEFYEIHNRRVKYYKDIIGVEDEYQKYKENKMRMTEIQEIIQGLKNNK
jgi:hypothetical protein